MTILESSASGRRPWRPLWRLGARRRHSPCDFERAPYLRDLPTISDYIAWMAGRRDLTARQEARLDAHLAPIREAVRDAGERWKARHDWGDWDDEREPTDAELLELEIENW